MDLHLFSAYDSPTTFSLNPPHSGQSPWHLITQPIAMGHLIETIWCHHRTNVYRMEEEFVSILHFVSPLARRSLL
jgi:hypothetical protein